MTRKIARTDTAKIHARARIEGDGAAPAKIAIFTADSRNAKVAGPGGRVAATYAPTAVSCPESCALRGAGCYAEGGRVGIQVAKLNGNAIAADASPSDVARSEADAIRGAFDGGSIPQDGRRGGRDLRIHVSGDARTRSAARALGAAARDWRARGGGDVWTYTHAWRDVPRASWGSAVSVLASLDDHRDASKARDAGYAPATVVPAFPEGARSFMLEGDTSTTWIACREQREGIPCNECRLCFSADRLRDAGKGIAFEAHGSSRGRIVRRLAVVR